VGQLLSNLLGNTRTHGASNKPVLVHAETTKEIFELWASNSGLPIPEAAMDKLFEPFFRGNAHASRQGLGLGLYIAFQIAKAHGGNLTVRSHARDALHVHDAARLTPKGPARRRRRLATVLAGERVLIAWMENHGCDDIARFLTTNRRGGGGEHEAGHGGAAQGPRRSSFRRGVASTPR
jgi:signal transduction histidine kinase